MIFPLFSPCASPRPLRILEASKVGQSRYVNSLFFFTVRYVKQSPLLIGNSSINRGFSIAMLVDMMFTWCLYDNYDSERFVFYCLLQCLSTEGSSES